MSDTSQDTGKSMWDFVNEVEAESPQKRPRRRAPAAATPTASDVGVSDQEPVTAPELGAADLPSMDVSDEPVGTDEPRRRKPGGLIAAAIAVVAVGATAFVYTQSTQTAQSGTSPTAVVAEQISPTADPATASVMVPNPTSVTPTAVRFTDALEFGSPFVVGKSLSDLVMASAPLPPVAALPTSTWKEAECSSCHAWTETNLCDQGKWYETHGDAAVNRIGHPYGGGFKRGLQVWAKQGCQ